MDDTVVYDLAARILDCARLGIEATSGDPLGRVGVVQEGPETAWDDCCDGQLTVNVTRVFPVSTWPQADFRSITHCGGGRLGVEMAVEVIRCAPTLGDNGESPSAEELEYAARRQHIDARAVWSAVVCCIAADRLLDGYVREQTWLGGGGCAGSRLALTLGISE